MFPPSANTHDHDNANANAGANKRKLEALRIVQEQTRNKPLPRLDSSDPSSTPTDTMSWFPSNPDTSQTPPTVPPRPPRTQQEAMASQQSTASEPNIRLMVEMGCDSDKAVKYLRAKGDDVNAALNAYFNNDPVPVPNEEERVWDEGLFAAGRDGEGGGDGGRLRTVPPSRAPSRSSMRPNTKEEEEADLRAAMEASQWGGSVGGQENGVVSSLGVENKTSSTAMILHPSSSAALAGSSSMEVIPDVEVGQRRNVPGEPRMLKPIPNAEYLAPFLTICHAIAGVREAMLMRDHLRMSYGQDPEWWRGHAIAMPTIVHTESGMPAEEAGEERWDGFVAEVQRLMAFLDAGERSYALGALMQTEVMERGEVGSTRTGTVLEVFLQEWVKAAEEKVGRERDPAGLFRSFVFAAEGDRYASEHLVFELRADLEKEARVPLAELMDLCLWRLDEGGEDYYLREPAEVIVLRVKNTNADAKQLNVEAPAEMYIDKYLREHLEDTRELRRELRKARRRIQKITAIENKLKSLTHPTKPNQRLDALALLNHTQHFFSTTAPTTTANGKDKNAHYPALATRLSQTLTSLTKTLTTLATEKSAAQTRIRNLSTQPPTTIPNQTHRYTLRGVATKPHITYVLHPSDSDEDPAVQDEDDHTPEGTQWWRLAYETHGSSARVSKTKTPDYDVLRAVELEGEGAEALLVYASDAVNDISLTDPGGLPEGLREFVERDRLEMVGEVGMEAPPSYGESSGGAMEVERVEGDEEEVAEIHLDDSDGGEEVEMVEKGHVPLVKVGDADEDRDGGGEGGAVETREVEDEEMR